MIQNALKIEGFMRSFELEWLAEAASKSKVIVEFGCFQGRSTRALADNCDGVIYAIDPWDGLYFNNDNTEYKGIDTDCYEIFKNNLNDHINSGKVVPYKMKSTDFKLDINPDMVFIDGDHRYEAVKADIEIAKRILKKGIISGHDYIYEGLWPGVKKAVDELIGPVELHHSIWWVEIE